MYCFLNSEIRIINYYTPNGFHIKKKFFFFRNFVYPSNILMQILSAIYTLYSSNVKSAKF